MVPFFTVDPVMGCRPVFSVASCLLWFLWMRSEGRLHKLGAYGRHWNSGPILWIREGEEARSWHILVAQLVGHLLVVWRSCGDRVLAISQAICAACTGGISGFSGHTPWSVLIKFCGCIRRHLHFSLMWFWCSMFDTTQAHYRPPLSHGLGNFFFSFFFLSERIQTQSVYVHVPAICVCVCQCVHEREKERERERNSESGSRKEPR